MKSYTKLAVLFALAGVLALAGCESKTYVHKEADVTYVEEGPTAGSTSVPHYKSSRKIDTRGDKTYVHEEGEAEIVIQEGESIW